MPSTQALPDHSQYHMSMSDEYSDEMSHKRTVLSSAQIVVAALMMFKILGLVIAFG